MQKITGFRHLLVAMLLLVTTACGFHLRGAENLPFQNLYLQDSGAPSISRDLKRSLKNSGVKLTATPAEAQASLELMSEQYDKRILSLSGTGRVKEYLLVYDVTFRLRSSGTELWGPAQTTEMRRDFTYDDSQALAKTVEEARLAADMRTEAIREVLRRVSSLSKSMPVTTEKTEPAVIEKSVPAATPAPAP
ncbi:MAG TPA: LPS assembly lipoprotein LptE [Methylophilaceae bacterium]|jgi:LPS-assembly lipoprotein